MARLLQYCFYREWHRLGLMDSGWGDDFWDGAAPSSCSQRRWGEKGRRGGPPALPVCWHCCPNTAARVLCNIWTVEESNCGLHPLWCASVCCVSMMGSLLLFVIISFVAFTTYACRCRSLQRSQVCLNQIKFGLWCFLTGSPLKKGFWIGTCQFWLLLFRNGGIGIDFFTKWGKG